MLGNADDCELAADDAGVVHLVTRMGSVINYGTFE
jgi:hypothetical protein